MTARLLQRVVGVASFIILMLVVAGAQVPKGLEGTWTLNVAKSKFNPGPAPKSMTLTYAVAPGGLKIAAHVVPAEGPDQHWEMTYKSDGKDYPVTGNPNADSISHQGMQDGRTQSTFKKGGKVTAVNLRTLSADGKTLTIESKGTDDKGQPMHNVQVFEK
jgi:hypothetical protein